MVINTIYKHYPLVIALKEVTNVKQIVFTYEHFPSATMEELKDELEFQKEINGMQGTVEDNREQLEKIVEDSYYDRFMDDQGNEFETAGVNPELGVVLYYDNIEEYEDDLRCNSYDNIRKNDTFFLDFRELCKWIWDQERRDSQPKDIILTYDIATASFSINRNVGIMTMTKTTHEEVLSRVEGIVAAVQAEFDLDNYTTDKRLGLI